MFCSMIIKNIGVIVCRQGVDCELLSIIDSSTSITEECNCSYCSNDLLCNCKKKMMYCVILIGKSLDQCIVRAQKHLKNI